MIFIEVGIILLFIGLTFATCREYLNRAKSKLDELGLPMTFDNVFFLSANKEAAARENIRRIMEEDEVLLARETLAPKLFDEIEDIVAMGHSWADAVRIVLLKQPKQENVGQQPVRVNPSRLKQKTSI